MQIIENWPIPSSVKEHRSFLGLAEYYRKFVKNFGLISRPLPNLLKKGELFVWTSITEEAFQTLKQELMSAAVLACLTFLSNIETDDSDLGVGDVLHQDGHPVAYM